MRLPCVVVACLLIAAGGPGQTQSPTKKVFAHFCRQTSNGLTVRWRWTFPEKGKTLTADDMIGRQPDWKNGMPDPAKPHDFRSHAFTAEAAVKRGTRYELAFEGVTYSDVLPASINKGDKIIVADIPLDGWLIPMK